MHSQSHGKNNSVAVQEPGDLDKKIVVNSLPGHTLQATTAYASLSHISYAGGAVTASASSTADDAAGEPDQLWIISTRNRIPPAGRCLFSAA